MGILSWAVFGLIAGLIAKFIMPTGKSSGLIKTILVGIAGALVGGFIASQFGWGTVEGFDFRSIAIAVGGAVLLLWVIGSRK